MPIMFIRLFLWFIDLLGGLRLTVVIFLEKLHENRKDSVIFGAYRDESRVTAYTATNRELPLI